MEFEERRARVLKLRERMVEELRRELVGPDPGLLAVQAGLGAEADLRNEEILRPEDPPRIRYGAGVLFPARISVPSQESAEAPEVASEGASEHEESANGSSTGRAPRAIRTEADTEQEINRSNEWLPSALGVTCFVEVPPELCITVDAARYEPVRLPGQDWEDSSGKRHETFAWRRIPIHAVLRFRHDDLVEDGPVIGEQSISTGSDDVRLRLHVFSRPLAGAPADRGARMVTLTLLNDSGESGPALSNQTCLFQCRLRASAEDGSACFIEYPMEASDIAADDRDDWDEDEESLRLLYRKRRVFAVGHGCAAEWIPSPGDATTEIWSESIPLFEIAPILPTSLEGLDLRMRALADTTGEAAVSGGLELCRRYLRWIESSERAIEEGDIPSDLERAAHRHVSNARACLDRMTAGIEILRSDSKVRQAFSLMNRAMLMQQLHYRISTDSIREWIRARGSLELESAFEPPDYDTAKNSWYPFQFAFILMSLKGMADGASGDRALVDVIWFPTGGGKTEAYLGLSAFTILLRRLRDPSNAGTTVLMRYTLRLLTTQQYQRAASLICAMELLRREHERHLGRTPITIGLWVGGGVTPNKEDDAVRALQRMLNEGGADNPFVILSCPWCGARMGAIKDGSAYQVKGYRQFSNPKRVRHVCEDADCQFGDEQGLPLRVVDEGIYAEPPTLVIGTVDKFALLPWYPASANLFGLGTSKAGGPPDLIVQDELHLISGPLGSMVGHYETVIEQLCNGAGGQLVKIVASTATVARAGSQVQALYGRQGTALFPPQGLEWGDSFFAKERQDLPGRVYVGVFASALPSQQTTMIRVISSLLQSPLLSDEADPTVIDAFWTLIGYFNSIRELGSAATLVAADIREYLGVLHERKAISRRWGLRNPDLRRLLGGGLTLELTSRISRGEISRALDRLFVPYDGSRGEAVDVCLATNMIQVGLDVSRLGLMVVAGQPKTAAEYIQATSRVGRSMPGLVITVLNPSKPRDRSHYEHFRAFHESIYRWVEPTSLTPYAVPVRERALHALIVTLARFWGPHSLRDRPNPPPSDDLAGRILETIVERANEVDPREVPGTRKLIENRIDEWRRVPPPKYGSFAPPDSEVPLMYPAGTQPLPEWDDRPLATPSSMRSVDATCNAEVLGAYPVPMREDA